MLAAKQPLVVPMLLRLSHFKLNSYVVLVVSKQKGITLVFKTDPLQNVDINSTFDSIAVIQKFIQREIEGQLRQMFREDLPGIIHRLSQQWVKAKVEAPYLDKRPPPVTRHPLEMGSMTGMSLALHHGRSRSTSGSSKSSSPIVASSVTKPEGPPPYPNPASPDFDLENFDPTYGLRPEGLPTKSVFRGFSGLFSPSKGLADLKEEQELSEPDEEYDDKDDGAASFDFVNWEYSVSGSERETRTHPTQSVAHDPTHHVPEYETIPAVGGGTVTRPRVYHSQSMIHLPAPNPLASAVKRHPKYTLPTPLSLPPSTTAPGLISRHPGTSALFAAGPRLSRHPSIHSVTRAPPSSTCLPTTDTLPIRRSFTPDSLETQPSQSSSGHGQTSTPPTSDTRDDDDIHIHHRRSSFSSVTTNSNLDNAFSFTTGSSPPTDSPDPKIVLRPSHNNSIHQLSTLSHSNHTLSPYTHSLEHFAVRSGPPRSAGVHGGGLVQGGSSGERQQPMKARRKRTFHIGRGKEAGGERPRANTVPTPSSTPDPQTPHRHVPSEFDVGDMDRYFRSFDEHDLDHDIPQHSSPLRKSASATLRQRLSHAPHLQRLYTQNYDLHPG